MDLGSLLPLAGLAAGAGIGIPPSALAALSAAVLLLLLDHRRANLGTRAAVAFLVASCGYGLIRSFSIRALSDAQLGGAPYRLNSPLLTVAGVPLQELLGWTVAVGLASYLADRLLRRLGQPTDPYRTTLVAGLCMAAVCLAVETAAVVGGWWTWSLAHSREDLRFPAIALLDWGFVAIDFLLPFELWRRRSPLGLRLASLLIFPIHLAGHALTARLPGPIPLSGFDVVHAGLIAAVIAAASASKGQSAWPAIAAEEQRVKPLLAAVILLATAAVQLMLAGDRAALWTGLPLLALAVVVASSRHEPAPRSATLTRSRAAWLFAIVLALGLAARLPSAQSSREFETLLRRAAEQLVAKDADGALRSLDGALAIRPNHSEALWLLGWAEMQKGNNQQARRHLEAALERRPDSKEAAQLLAILDNAQGRRP